MAGAFDDLIPAQSAQQPQGFDDLIPQGDPSQWGPSMEAANSAMFGMGPKINQMITGQDASKQEADAKAWKQQNSAPMGADGSFWSVKGPGWSPSEAGLADTVGGSVPYAAAGAATGGWGFLPEMAAQAGVGAAGNSLLPLSKGQDPTSAAIGGAASGAGGKLAGALLGSTLGAAGRGVAGAFKAAPNVPTAAGLQAAKSAAYEASEAAGDMASPEGLQRLKDAMTGTMANYDYDPALQPGGQAVVNRMNAFPKAPSAPPDPGYTVTPTATPGGGPMPLYTGSSPPPAIPGSLPPSTGTPIGSPPLAGMTLKGLDGFRQVVNRMREGGPSGENLASKLTGNIDDFVNNPQPGDWLGGDGPQGSGSLNAARKLAQTGFKYDAFNEAMSKAADQASSTGTGGNIRNKLAQAAVNLKYGDQNWTPDEMSALQGAITPQTGEQPLRVLGKLDPTSHGGVGLMEGVVGLPAAYAEGGPKAVAAAMGLGATAAAARRLSDAMVKGSTNRVGQTILNGGVNPNADSAAQAAISSATPYMQRGMGSLIAATPGSGQ